MSREKVAAAELVIKAARRLVEEAVPIPDNDSAYVTKANLAELRAALKPLEPKHCGCLNTAKKRHQLSVLGHTAGTVACDEELAGPDGCYFYLFPSPNQKPEALKIAKQRLHRDRDVVGRIRVIEPCPHEGVS